MPNWPLRASACLIALACAAPAPAATLLVTAVVRPSATLQFPPVPASLAVSAGDVQRGYVEAAPLPLSAQATSRQRVSLSLTLHGPLVRLARVQGAGATLDVPGGATALLPLPPSGGPMELRLRFYLAPDAVPGVYPWPVQVAASA